MKKKDNWVLVINRDVDVLFYNQIRYILKKMKDSPWLFRTIQYIPGTLIQDHIYIFSASYLVGLRNKCQLFITSKLQINKR